MARKLLKEETAYLERALPGHLGIKCYVPKTGPGGEGSKRQQRERTLDFIFLKCVCVYLFLLVRRKEGEEGKPEQHERLQDLYKQSARQPILHLAHCSSVSAS